jgi:hypothetical protein
MEADDEVRDFPAEEPQPPGRYALRLIITLVLVPGFLIGIDQLYQHLSPLLFPAVPGVTLTDVNSVDDLYTRFTQASGKPRLILFVSPT